jgi:hypothetical protein
LCHRNDREFKIELGCLASHFGRPIDLRLHHPIPVVGLNGSNEWLLVDGAAERKAFSTARWISGYRLWSRFSGSKGVNLRREEVIERARLKRRFFATCRLLAGGDKNSLS